MTNNHTGEDIQAQRVCDRHKIFIYIILSADTDIKLTLKLPEQS